MQNRILILIVVILVPIAVISFKNDETNFNLVENKKTVEVRLKNVDNNEVINIDLEEYIIGVVAAEMPASFEIEALKAQAVAARTYAYYKIKQNNDKYDLVSEISDQGYITKEEMYEKWGNDYELYYSKIKSAVDNTANEIVTYNNEVICAYYFAMSNGYTENSSLVFEEQEPYLESVISKWDNKDINNFQVEKAIDKNEFCTLLNLDCNTINISKIERSNTNRVTNITINNESYTGIEVRKKLDLRSTDFTIEILDDSILITTIGYGHGVGMSQYGANGMAKEGYDYKEILTYYYTNTNISQI